MLALRHRFGHLLGEKIQEKTVADHDGESEPTTGKAERIRVNAFDYLRDVLVRVSSHPARDVLALSPKAWKKALQNVEAAQSPSAA